MNLSELILNDIKPVEMSQKILLTQQMFNNLTYSHIPVSEEDDFIGCISANDAHCFDSESSILDCKYVIELFFVIESANWLDVLEAFAQNNTNIMPVMNNNNYIGYYELKDIIKRLFKEHIKFHLKRLYLCLFLAIVVAGATAAIAWLLDPAVKKIFIDKNQTLAWLIPIVIIIAFTTKGISLYFARININIVGNRISGEMQKRIAKTSNLRVMIFRNNVKRE